MIENGIEAGYAAKLVQFGWETITEALKHGGITNMRDRLSNPAKIKAFEETYQTAQTKIEVFEKKCQRAQAKIKVFNYDVDIV